MSALRDDFYRMLASRAQGLSRGQCWQRAGVMEAEVEATAHAAKIVGRPIRTAMAGRGEPTPRKLADMAAEMVRRKERDGLPANPPPASPERQEAKATWRRVRQLKKHLAGLVAARHRTAADVARRHRQIERYADRLVAEHGRATALAILRRKIELLRLGVSLDLD